MVQDLRGAFAAPRSDEDASNWSLVAGICLGVMGATWVASFLTRWWPSIRYPNSNSWHPQLLEHVVPLVLGLLASWFGFWLLVRGDSITRLLRAGLASVAVVGFVIAGLSSMPLVSLEIFTVRFNIPDAGGGSFAEYGEPMLIGLAIGLAALYGFIHIQQWRPRSTVPSS